MGIIVSILLYSVASIFLKYGALNLKELSVLGILSTPYYLIALLAFGAQAIIWQYTLRKYSLSKAYMWTAAYYPILLTASVVLFSEQITIPNLIGTFFIIVGILLLADSSRGVTE